jgi:hypothetical protein
MRDYIFQLKGGTASPLSPQLRYLTTRAELESLDTRRAAGETIDFDQYKTVADAFLAASRDYQGSSLSFFADMKRITDTVNAMINNSQGGPTPTYPTVDISRSPRASAIRRT